MTDRGITIPIRGPIDDRANVQAKRRDRSELPEEYLGLVPDRNSAHVRSAIEVLEGKYTMRCIIYLHTRGAACRSDIARDLTRSGTFSERIRILIDFGLIREYGIPVRGGEALVLTPKGKRVAEMIEEILDILDAKEKRSPPYIICLIPWISLIVVNRNSGYRPPAQPSVPTDSMFFIFRSFPHVLQESESSREARGMITRKMRCLRVNWHNYS